MSESLVCAECQKPAELKCSGCKSVAYCTKEHQKLQWKTHKDQCRPFEIKTDPELGKCLIATRDLQPGDLIVSEYPLVHGPRPHMVEEGPVPCVGCCRLIICEASPKCPGCDWPVCHPDCGGLKDVTKHGVECFVLGLRRNRLTAKENNHHEFYRQDALMALRCLLLQNKSPKKWDQLMEYESHIERRGSNTEAYKDAQERIVKYLRNNFLGQLEELEKQANQQLLADTSPETIHKVCGIIENNSVEVNIDAEMSALYPTACLLEQSCVFNTCHAFEDASQNYMITVRACVPIMKGDHLSTIYTHALWGTQARREHLQETRYFSCKCKRCSDPTELGTYLSALRCIGVEGKPCNGTQLPLDPCNMKTEWACDSCDMKLTNDEVAFLVNKLGEEVDHVQLSNPTVKELNQLMEKILTFLHPHHYHVYSVKHSLVQLYGYQNGYMPNQISDELLVEKSKMCRELIDITARIDPGHSRLQLYSSVLLHELHLANIHYVKRKWHVEPKEELLKLVKEGETSMATAKTILKNEKTAAGQKLFNLIGSSEKELKKWLDTKSEEIEEITKAVDQLSV